MKNVFIIICSLLLFISTEAQYTGAGVNYQLSRSGKFTATGAGVSVITLASAIGTLRVIGRSPDGGNYTTGEYRIINGGWNFPQQASISTLSSTIRGAGVALSITPSDGGHGNMNILISATSGSLIFWSFEGATEQAIIKVGDSYQGGIVAYVLQSGDPGYDPYVPHGIIAAPSDQSSGIQWYNGVFILTNASSTSIGSGRSNTSTIILTQGGGGGNYAAKLCDDLVLNGYSDWYLPSLNELAAIRTNMNLIGGLVPHGYYWTSTERPVTNGENLHEAYFVRMESEIEPPNPVAYYKNQPNLVRAVRSF